MRSNDANDTRRGRRAPDFSYSNKTKAKPTTYRSHHSMTWWGPYGCGVSFEGLSGANGAGRKNTER